MEHIALSSCYQPIEKKSIAKFAFIFLSVDLSDITENIKLSFFHIVKDLKWEERKVCICCCYSGLKVVN